MSSELPGQSYRDVNRREEQRRNRPLKIKTPTPLERAVVAVQAVPREVLLRAAEFGGNLDAEERIAHDVLEAYGALGDG